VFVAKNILSALVVHLVALSGVAQAAPGFDPEPFEAHFELEVRGFTVGETVWRVRRVDDGFVYETRTKAIGLAAVFGAGQVVERSEWKRVGDDVKPASYLYERSGRPEKTTAIAFDWSDGIVESTRRGQTSRMSVPGDTLDKLGYMLVLREDLKAGKRSVRYHIANGKNRMKVYELKVVAEERLNTALGDLGVIRIVRERKGDDRETTIWVAPELDFMPVRIEHREREDEVVTINIRSFSRRSMPGNGGAEEVEAHTQPDHVPEDKR
jgi:hypothetical protein